MQFQNARIFTGSGFRRGGFSVEDGIFTRLRFDAAEEGVDLNGARVIPGLIDIHTHGNSGADFSDGEEEGLHKMGRFCAQNGVTAFAPASMTLPYETLEKAFGTAAAYVRNRSEDEARLIGIHMEGPFLSETKKGAQNGAYLRAPDWEAFTRLYESCGGLVRFVDLAPELAGAEAFAARASRLCTVSVSHTAADYETACRVLDAGASHLTHLFNAMPGIHHRHPGPICAASERENVYAELICDGLHVHPSAVRAAFKLFPGRICLVSDALRCAGMPEGEYELGGQRVFRKGGIARLADGTLAGAAANLYDGLVNAIRFGVDPCEAIRAATCNNARQAGCLDRLGSIEEGKCADFIICGEGWERRAVYLGGNRVG